MQGAGATKGAVDFVTLDRLVDMVHADGRHD
jgi:hypothetical protein